MKIVKWLVALLIVLGIVFFSGPKPSDLYLSPLLPVVKGEGELLETTIKTREAKENFIKPDNHSRIIWADSIRKSKTPVSIVYLHGFSASPQEGNPVHVEFAKRYGCNLYIPRLHNHGLDEQEPLLGLSAEELLNSAKEAVAIGKLIGDKLILMSTSTGGTLSLYIASGNPDIRALILYSPNIDLYDSRSFVLVQPWGLQLARMINGSPYYHFDGPEGYEKYWTPTYRIEGLISLKMLLEETMNEKTFAKISSPVFLGYYSQDDVVSVPRMMEMFEQLNTSPEQKRKVAFPLAKTHAIASDIWCQDIEGVQNETYKFAEEILRMKVVR